ncbi:MAG: U32 family peptidase [Clostridia bacterium]|nr:U32 family peptidase [Clostridia bacterium]
MIELLSPVGDFECLKAAVQNGADAVYFGAGSFSARAFATNFDDEALEKAITYAKLRGVKTNLTLNTLIKNSEMRSAIELAKKAYEFGIDAIIVQDLGLARYLIKNFPGLSVHASTQMSVHSLEGVLSLQKMGFSRVVLSRELSLQEIEYICQNSNIEIEVFVHGALCISYSGQCLFSSMVGGRSGNRGKCAQPCRLPYELLENDNIIDKGYLLSPRDLCGLEYLPNLVNAGVSCLKIEGRMKTPEYVATVTRIYRKYLDLAIAGQNFNIDEKDKKDLLQVFNRGGFSTGHLTKESNTDLIYKNKSNNMGIFLGTISNFNNNKGHISFLTADTVGIGDKISIENKKKETAIYTISELMINDKNVPQAFSGNKIKIGRMKGDISVGDKIYKISDKALSSSALATLDKELRKVEINCKMLVKKDLPVSLEISDTSGVHISITSDIIPVLAVNSPITKDRLIAQISKTNNTPFQFKNIEIDLDDGLFIQGISSINELRRQALSQYEEKLIQSFKRLSPDIEYINLVDNQKLNADKKISVLLNIINNDFDYTKLKNINNIYIPFKYFVLKDFSNTIQIISQNFDTYIYMPTIMRNNYKKLISQNLDNILNIYKIKGFVISNIGNLELLKSYENNYEFICNYTFNIFNNLSINELPYDIITLSPELNNQDLQNLELSKSELIVYGRTPLMNSNYCLLGKTNKCYSSCQHLCNTSKNKYYLKDRLGFLFRIIPDNLDTVTTIYNSKITSIEHTDINTNSVRLDILDETIDEINQIISIVKTGQKLEGKDYTNGNFKKEI